MRVTVPLSMPGIVAGTLLTFIPAAGDFINAALLGTPNQSMIGNVIQAKFLESLDYPTAASLSFILMGTILIMLLIYAKVVGIGEVDGMTTAVETLASPPRPSVASRAWRFVARHALTVYAILAVGYLMRPHRGRDHVLVQPSDLAGSTTSGTSSPSTTGSTGTPCSGSRAPSRSRSRSPLLATLVATALGTMIALAIVRHRFHGRGTTNVIVFLPMSTPEIVLGSSLLTLFLNDQNTIQLGFWTIFIAHVMFIISFVVVTVKARLIGFDRHLEEAAMDLGANEWMTFQKVTLPLLAPAILAAGLLGFALSIDDFVITYLNAGPVQTFPIFVWGVARVAVPPQVNVVASAIFLVAIILGLANVVWQYRSAKATRGAGAT